MKVIGNISYDKYICEVEHAEIEKFLNLYYSKMDKLKSGDIVDLGKGYNFARETKDAMLSTKKLIEDNQNVVSAILQGFNIISLMEEDHEKD